MKMRWLMVLSGLVCVVMVSVSSVFAAPAPVAVTGQTVSYAAGDDGSIRAGVALPTPRFNDTGNDTVVDNLSGLTWSKNADLAAATKSWQQALDYVALLNSQSYRGYSDWRLPNIVELQSLVDVHKSGSPALPAGYLFNNIRSIRYWSSTSYAGNSNFAWVTDLNSGFTDTYNKSQAGYLWPVRGGSSFPLFVTLAGAGTGTVTPSTGSFTWSGVNGSGSYNSGATVTLTALAGADSTFAGWSGGGCTGIGSCSVTMTSVQNVTATFAVIPHYTVTPATAGNGTVDPVVPQSVLNGSTLQFAVTPASGYAVDSVMGGTCPAGSWNGTVYTTGPITGNCTIQPNFTQMQRTVTPSSVTNGTILPSSLQTVFAGAMLQFTITPNSGYTVNPTIGGTCPAGSWNGKVYTTGAITSDCTVEPLFIANSVSPVINQVALDSCPTVTAFVSVLDQDGVPITGLSSSDFTVSEDGVVRTPVTVSTVNSAASPISAAMLLDVSGSMYNTNSLDGLKTAAISFINQIQTNDALEIITFSDVITVAQPFTSDKALLLSAVPTSAAGATHLYDAIYKGLTDTSARGGRKAVIVMTDGMDEYSTTYSLADVNNYAISLGIPVFTIGLGSANTPVMQDIAEKTGGSYYYAPDASTLEDIYRKVANAIQNQYEVLYSTGYVDGASHTMNITVNTASATSSVSRVFTTCSVPTASISGTVVDATNNQPVVGATVTFSGAVLRTATSGADGGFSLTDLPAGNYVLTVTNAGFIENTQTVAITSSNNTVVNIPISPVLAVGEYRTVLAWGDRPTDLDLYAYVPTSGSCYRVSWMDGGAESSEPYTFLDVDDVTGFGPETITIKQAQSGTYQFWVHNYSGENYGDVDITTSAATVTVYKGSSVLKTFTVPLIPTGNLAWHLFDLNPTAATNQLVEINTLETALNGSCTHGVGGVVTHPYINTTVGSTRTYNNGMTETVLANENGSITLENVDGTYIKQDAITVSGTAIAVTSSKEMNASRVITNTINFTPPIMIFPSSTAIGFTENQTVTATSSSSSGPSGTINCDLNVLAVEDVTVPSGTFPNSLKIRLNCAGFLDRTDWYAPGVGYVKETEAGNSYVWELTSKNF